MQRLDGSFGRSNAKTREPLELSQRGRAHPAKEEAAELRVGFHQRELEAVEGTRPPQGVLVALLIQTTVCRHATNDAPRLQPAERDRQRRGHALLLALLA